MLLQDYHHIYYPNTLPLRPPYSGDPSKFLDASRREQYILSMVAESTFEPNFSVSISLKF